MINVEPLIASELERMLPLPDGGRADWSDVLRRAGVDGAVHGRPRGLAPTGRRRWRPVLVAAVVLAALVGVGVGIAVTTTASGGQGIDDLLSQVQNSFRRQSSPRCVRQWADAHRKGGGSRRAIGC